MAAGAALIETVERVRHAILHSSFVVGKPMRKAEEIEARASSCERIRREFAAAVNMTADELARWLETDESKSVGSRPNGRASSESIGHASGRSILSILGKDAPELAPEDYAQMRRTIGFIRRHLAQEPLNLATSRWRYSLMNWGHDPLKDK
jgi:hypothetical protein